MAADIEYHRLLDFLRSLKSALVIGDPPRPIQTWEGRTLVWARRAVQDIVEGIEGKAPGIDGDEEP